MWPNPQIPADLVTFTEEILNGKLHFLCSVMWTKLALKPLICRFGASKLIECKINYPLSEPYLELSQISTMELFRKNSLRLLVVNYFRKKAPSQVFDWVLNTPLTIFQIG